jgi:hypothetical protein
VEECVDCMTPVVFRAGDSVIKAGELGGRLLAIDVGSVAFVEERRVEGRKKADRGVHEVAVRQNPLQPLA